MLFFKKKMMNRNKGIAMVEFAVFIIPAFFLFYFLLDLTALYRYKNKIHQIAANVPIMTLAKLHKHEALISQHVLKHYLEEISKDILCSFDDNIKKLNNCSLYINWFVRNQDIDGNKGGQGIDGNKGEQFNMIFGCEQKKEGFIIANSKHTTFKLLQNKSSAPFVIAIIGVKANTKGTAWYDLSTWFMKLLPTEFSENVIIEMPANFKIQYTNIEQE